jgi:hypothetical protein
MTDTPEFTRHSVSTDALDTLGTIIDPFQERDAIHLAVFPVQAGEAKLRPGDHCYIGADGKAYYAESSALGMGLVDPFIEMKRIPEDQWFWLVVYPRQITSLHHVWEHPRFPSTPAAGGNKKNSEAWLRNFAHEHEDVDFDALVGAVERHVSYSSTHDEYLTVADQINGDIPEAFWTHMERYLGVQIKERPKYFSCSC